jgi:hypothetical protein
MEHLSSTQKARFSSQNSPPKSASSTTVIPMVFNPLVVEVVLEALANVEVINKVLGPAGLLDTDGAVDLFW